MNRRSANCGTAGFSLVEMLVVLAVTAIVFTIGAISLSALHGRMTPDRVAAQIVDLLNDTSDRAMESGVEQSVAVDLRQKVFNNRVDPTIRLPDGFLLKVTLGKETVTSRQELEVIFLPDGTGSGAEIEISDGKDHLARITTNWLTGLTRQTDVEP